MTPLKAYDLICEKYNISEDKPQVSSCKEFKDYYAFTLVPTGTDKNAKVFIGRFMICVDKETGRVYSSEELERRPMFPIRFIDENIFAIS